MIKTLQGNYRYLYYLELAKLLPLLRISACLVWEKLKCLKKLNPAERKINICE
jgi:hypothetical protein